MLGFPIRVLLEAFGFSMLVYWAAKLLFWAYEVWKGPDAE